MWDAPPTMPSPSTPWMPSHQSAPLPSATIQGQFFAQPYSPSMPPTASIDQVVEFLKYLAQNNTAVPPHPYTNNVSSPQSLLQTFGNWFVASVQQLLQKSSAPTVAQAPFQPNGFEAPLASDPSPPSASPTAQEPIPVHSQNAKPTKKLDFYEAWALGRGDLSDSSHEAWGSLEQTRNRPIPTQEREYLISVAKQSLKKLSDAWDIQKENQGIFSAVQDLIEPKTKNSFGPEAWSYLAKMDGPLDPQWGQIEKAVSHTISEDQKEQIINAAKTLSEIIPYLSQANLTHLAAALNTTPEADGTLEKSIPKEFVEKNFEDIIDSIITVHSIGEKASKAWDEVQQKNIDVFETAENLQHELFGWGDKGECARDGMFGADAWMYLSEMDDIKWKQIEESLSKRYEIPITIFPEQRAEISDAAKTLMNYYGMLMPKTEGSAGSEHSNAIVNLGGGVVQHAGQTKHYLKNEILQKPFEEVFVAIANAMGKTNMDLYYTQQAAMLQVSGGA